MKVNGERDEVSRDGSVLQRSGAEFRENVDDEEAREEHGAEQCGLGLFVSFDEQFLYC